MDIILFVGGLVLLFQKEVKISSKKTLRGQKVKILGILCILPFVVGILGGLMVQREMLGLQTLFWINIPLVVIAILTTLYFILFYKEKSES
jgi:hypothetical protein